MRLPRWFLVATCALPLTGGQTVNRAIARMRGTNAMYAGVSGYVLFEQPVDAQGEGLEPVTVHVQITGLTPGQHGFHVHQYGDVRFTDSLETMGAHFVPQCAPPNIDEDGNPIGSTECQDDAIHGLPPSQQRQPGDMGNINILPDGTPDAPSSLLTIGQRKMSLTHTLRSIVGRTVVVHSRRDDGSQPFGNAGIPEAYGVIGLASTPLGSLNDARPPVVPHVTKIMCTFEPPAGDVADGQPTSTLYVGGFALVSLLEPREPGTVRVQAHLTGLTRRSSHSFHFHEWGDLTVDMNDGSMGAIYQSNAIDVESLRVNSQGVGMLDVKFASGGFDTGAGASSGLQRHVGRSLTIHLGDSSSSPTIAAAVCGIAHPHAKLETDLSDGTLRSTVSPGAIFLCVLTAIVVLSCLCIGALYYLRYPIPFCGKWLYEGDFDVPPPPTNQTVPIMHVEKI